MKKTDLNRLNENRQLLKILEELIEKNPSERFSQILRNNEFISEHRDGNNMPIFWENEFYLESEALLQRVKKGRKND